MNRKNEFEAMIEELNQPAPGLEATLDRAYKKKRKRTTQLIVRPLAGLAACFAVFVLLVNFCAPVAYACSQTPVLKELAEAVTFSRSLTDVVENYKQIDAWCASPVMKEESFDRLQMVMTEAGELSQKAPFDEIVDNSFAEKAK